MLIRINAIVDITTSVDNVNAIGRLTKAQITTAHILKRGHAVA